MRVQCCICSDLFVNNGTDIAATPCGHVFHEHCLARWLINSSTCPSCRKIVIQNAVIPKLFFDIAEEEPGDADPEKLSNELQNLRTRVTELTQARSQHKAKEKELRDVVKKREEELENLRMLLQREQDTGAAQQRLLQHYEAQQKVQKEERAEFLRTQRKLSELKHVETLVNGCVKDSEEILQQYGSGDRSSFQQLARYAAILKREYEQAKVEKRSLKEQLDKLRRSSYAASRDLAEVKTTKQLLQEQLARSEEDLKQAEQTSAALKAQVRKLLYGKRHPGTASGSFLETPKRHDVSDDASGVDTPKLSLEDREELLDVTPRMTRPPGSELIDLGDPTASPAEMNHSFDLFEESPRTRVKRTCEENNVKAVKISSAAATAAKASKRLRVEEEASSFPLSALNIMKKRETTGQLLGKTVMRKDYNGLGGTSRFTQPLGPPRFAAPRGATTKGMKRAKLGSRSANPALPTLDGFIDLS